MWKQSGKVHRCCLAILEDSLTLIWINTMLRRMWRSFAAKWGPLGVAARGSTCSCPWFSPLLSEECFANILDYADTCKAQSTGQEVMRPLPLGGPITFECSRISGYMSYQEQIIAFDYDRNSPCSTWTDLNGRHFRMSKASAETPGSHFPAAPPVSAMPRTTWRTAFG